MSGIPAGAGSLLGKRLGKYEILALLALGGTAEIYLARIGGAAGFEKYVVVKCLHDHLADDAEFVKMFLDEARLAAHLDHSNIVQTMELGEHEHRYYMVMEFLAGLSLAMIVRRAGERLPGGRLPVPLVLNLLAQACAGLHYAHEKTMNGKPLQIVHRDISPQNLVVSFEGVVKVVDFGIAKAELRETQTKSGTIKGKFAYMSPEQCVANRVDRRTDVFALGVIAHELLTGRRLFKKSSPYDTYQAVIDCSVDPPSKYNVELDPALDEIVLRALRKDREQRYPTAEAFGDALLGYLHHRGKGSGPGEVARFFDTRFAQEIEEHSARMRELISGQDPAGGDAGWGEDDEVKRNETVDLGARGGRADEPSMVVERAGGDAGGRGGPGRSSEDDDRGAVRADTEAPVDKTRIEMNPLEQVRELDRVVKQKTPPPALIPTQLAAPGPRPLPPSGALPLPAPPTAPMRPAPAAPPAGGKFPALADLPTQIAGGDLDEDSEELGATQLGMGLDDATVAELGDPSSLPTPVPAPAPAGSPAAQRVDPHARTSIDMAAPSLRELRSAAAPAPGAPAPAGPGVAVSDLGYPVMTKELREEIETGANVFPSGNRPSVPGAPVPSPPRVGDSAPRPLPEAAPSFPRAADLASPVGQRFPEAVDWAAAAAMPAKAIAPWKLALLFVGVVGGALGLTLLVALIVRG